MNPEQQLINRTISARDEILRATVLSEPVLTPFDTAGLRARMWLISVNVSGVSRPIEGVIVQSQTGTGGRQYARVGKPVLIKRNAKGRWLCIGPSDRITGVGNVQFLDESSEVGSAPTPGEGFTFDRVPFEFYAANGLWANGTTPFNLVRRLDAQGNEV